MRGGGSEDEGGALCYSLGVEEIGGCDDVLEKLVLFLFYSVPS